MLLTLNHRTADRIKSHVRSSEERSDIYLETLQYSYILYELVKNNCGRFLVVGELCGIGSVHKPLSSFTCRFLLAAWISFKSCLCCWQPVSCAVIMMSSPLYGGRNGYAWLAGLSHSRAWCVSLNEYSALCPSRLAAACEVATHEIYSTRHCTAMSAFRAWGSLFSFSPF